MNKLTKKLAIITAILTVIVLIFAGCNSNDQTTEPTNETTEAVQETTETTDEQAVEETEEAKPELLMVRIGSNTVALANDGNEVNLIQRISGYKINIEFYDSDDAKSQVVMDIASGKKIDFISNLGDISLITEMAQNGAILELTSLIEDYGSDINALFDDAVWGASKIDGGIYFLPNEGIDIAQIGNICRTDWLEELGYDFPATLDELVEILRAVKENDPGNVGEGMVIPLTFVSTSFPFLEQYGLNYDFIDVNGELVSKIQTDEMKEYIAFMKGLYDEGLIDTDFLINTSDEVTSKMMANRVFMTGNSVWTTLLGFNNTIADQAIDIQLSYAPLLEGAEGVEAYSTSTYSLSVGAVIPATSEHPEDVMKYFNTWATEENYKTYMCGEEGVHHQVIDGAIYPILPAYTDEVGNMNLFQTFNQSELYLKYWLPRTRKTVEVQTAFENCYNTYLGTSKHDPLANALVFPTYSSNKTALRTLVSDTIAKMIMGVDSMDNYDAFVQEWLGKGGADALVEVNEWYAAHK